MKKKTGIILIAILSAILTLVGCFGSNDNTKNVSTSSIVDSIKSGIELRATAPVEGDLVIEKFYLNTNDIEESTIETGVINTGLETIAVVKAKPDKADTIKKAFEMVIEDKKANAFYPGESEAVDSAIIKEIGDYVGLFIIPDYEEGQNNSQKAVEIFENSLK